MRKIFRAIGKVIIRLMVIVVGMVAGISIARFLPLWLWGIILVCALVVLVICQMEEEE